MMSAPRAFLASSRLMKIPTRGKALANWARPSIDEMGVPTEAWSTVHAKGNMKGNIHLVLGGCMFAFTSTVFMNGTPHHLLK